MELKQIAKSKTIGFNLLAVIVLQILSWIDVTITPELTAEVVAACNIVLRFLTTKAIADK